VSVVAARGQDGVFVPFSCVENQHSHHILDVTIAPARYNPLYRKIGNLNRLLAWGHARVIEDLCALCPECPRALSDKFADVRVLEKALMEKGRQITLEQRTKAESDYAVAAASILAREKFINWLDEAGKVIGIELLCACQGLDLGEPLSPGRGVAAAYRALRARVAGLEGDRYLAPDLRVAEEVVLDGSLVAAAEAAVGELSL
jgi:hypothetical protein